jgi:hypothetical protein
VEAAAQARHEFVELLNEDLDAWVVEHSNGDNFEFVDGVLRVGGPEGWLRSKRQYGDFDLDVEFRFATDVADSGVFFRAAGVEPFSRGWPNRSYQLQMLNPAAPSRFAPLGGLFRHGMPDAHTQFDEALARRVTSATGEWQRLEIEVRAERAQARINGATVLDAGGIGNEIGYIGLQGETDTVEFRSLKVRERP